MTTPYIVAAFFGDPEQGHLVTNAIIAPNSELAAAVTVREAARQTDADLLAVAVSPLTREFLHSALRALDGKTPESERDNGEQGGSVMRCSECGGVFTADGVRTFLWSHEMPKAARKPKHNDTHLGAPDFGGQMSYEQGFKPGWGYGPGLATPTCAGALAPHHPMYKEFHREKK